MALDKVLTIYDENGNPVDYDILAKDVKFTPDGKDLPTKLAEMEQEIEDAAGGGYAPPAGGIPKSDLASGVQSSLDKADTALQQSDKTELRNEINNKVDKVNGKGLSTNDYTDAEKTKLAGIAAGAQVNVINGIQTHDGTPLTPQNGIVTLPEQTEIDLDDYYDKDEVDALIDDKLTEVTVNAVGNSASMYFAGSALCIASANLIQVTATPTITYVDNEQNVVVSVSGNGTLKAYLDGVEQTLVDGSFTIAKIRDPQSVVVTATAKEDGKAISAEAELPIEVGAYVDISNLLIGYSTNETPFDVFINATNMNSAGKVSVDTTDTKTFDSTTCYKFTVDLTDYIESESATSFANQHNTSIFGVGTSGSISSVREISHIPSYFTTIGEQCFLRSSAQTAGTPTGLTHVVIPSSITQFAAQAFKNCLALDAITFEGSTPPTLSTVNSSNSPLNGIQNKTITFNVPSGTVQTYAAESSYQTNVNWLTGVSIQITDGTETATITKQS